MNRALRALAAATSTNFSLVRALLAVTFAFCMLSSLTFAQRQAEEESNDLHILREQWFRLGRQSRDNQPAAAHLYRAHEQKEQIRTQQRSLASSSGIVPASTTPTWQNLGPGPMISDWSGTGFQDYGFVSGRVTAAVVDQADTTGNTVYVGGAYGGVWKSTNAANSVASNVTWTPLIDSQATLAVGSIALQPGNSSTILVATGEPNFAWDTYYGLGILRSTNGGSTWTLINTSNSGAISFEGLGFGQIVFNPASTSFVVAANSFASPFANLGLSNTNEGLFYSTDAGATWTKGTITDGTFTYSAPATSVVYNQSNSTWYAAVGFLGFFSSSDGKTWNRLPDASQPGTAIPSSLCTASNANWPASCPMDRGVLAVRPGANEMYAYYVNGTQDQGVYKSTNGASTWTELSLSGFDPCSPAESGCGSTQGDYNMELAAVPDGSGTDLYLGTVNIFKCNISTNTPTCNNGWLNLTHVYGCSPVGAPAHVHPDQHAIDFSLSTPSVIYFGNDGGIYRTINGTGLTSGSCSVSNPFDNLNATMGSITQLYAFSQHPTDPATLLGGSQDNNTFSITGTTGGANGTTWTAQIGGDGFYNAINPSNPSEWLGSNYSSANGGTTIYRCTTAPNCQANNFATVITQGTQLAGDRASFVIPFLQDPAALSQVIIGTYRVWRGNSNGTSWSTSNVLSPSLTNGFIWSLAAGGPSTASGSQVIYAGTSDGLVWYTTNASGGSSTWLNRSSGITNPNGEPISSIVMDNTDATGQTAYVAVMGFGSPHVYKTTTGGGQWTDISGNLPNAPADSLAIDPTNHNIVYVGTDIGVFSADVSQSPVTWAEFGALPNVPVLMLGVFHTASTNMLRAATHGRGVWQVQLGSAATDTLTVNKAGTGSGTVASTSPDNQINCGATCSGNYAPATSVTLNATPNSGSTFTSFSGCTSTSGTSCTVTVNSNPTTVTATFTATAVNYALTVNLAGTGSGTVTSSPAGINCPSTCSANFASGTDVTLTATANGTSSFAGYGGACLGGTCSLVMNAPEAVTATFATSSPVLTSLSPSSAVAGSANPVNLSVTGANFVSGANVVWNGSNLATTFVNSSQLTATIPTADLAATGIASVTVTNPSGGGTSNPLSFDILEAFGGTGGYLSMFVNGADLGNSALFQGNCPATGQPCIGIGNTAPIRTLDVSGEIQARGGNLFLQRNLTDLAGRRNWAWGTETANVGDMAFFVSTSNSNFPSVNVMTLLSNGNVGIGPVATTPATTLQVGGDIRMGTTGTNGCLQNFAGTALAGTCSSDLRLKTNILPFAPVLNKLVLLEPVHFDWNREQYPDYHFGPGRNSGLLAQDVEKVFPDLVSIDAHGYKAVNYSELPYLTLAAIRELKTENDALRAQLADRQRELEELQHHVVSVEARLAKLEKPPAHAAKKKKVVQHKPAVVKTQP